jgi:Fic family protein
MKEKYISKSLGSEIRQGFASFRRVDIPERVMKCHSVRQRAIEKNAQIHSYRIENHVREVPFSVPRNKGRKRIKKGINDLGNAVEWGRENFNPDRLEESFIREIAGRIIPEIYSNFIARYRSSAARIVDSRTVLPSPEKLVSREIPEFIESLKKQMKCEDLIDRIETAIYSHLHIVRMHPFVDGNGRTARTFQDIILDSYGIPLPVIEAGERMFYYDLLEEAILDWNEQRAVGDAPYRITDSEKRFYEFMGSKVNISLDKILNSCSHSLI